jgi:hypothetical protein
MPAQIAAWLGEQEPLAEIVFIPEYPAVKKAVPLRQAIVAVGLENATITDKFEANDTGVLERQEYCRTAKLRIRLGIHAPYALGGEYCHTIFTMVADCLTFGSDLEITQSAAGRIISDRDTDAFVLESYLDVTADFCPAESSDLTFPSFLSKDLLCGSHIGNTDLHFSDTEKQKFTQPFVIGVYSGTDAATRTINLGFAPRVVIVFAQDFPPMAVAGGTSSQASYWGIAAGGMKSQGILLSSSGFTVLSSAGQTVRNVLARLNEAGLSYGYVAWK